MTTNRAHSADRLTPSSDREQFGVFAEVEDLDQRALWRLGSWAVSAIGALVLAILVSQSSVLDQQGQVVSADLTRQAQQIQRLTKDAQTELSRLGAAIDTLNGDRDRLFTRVTVLEQNLESVTGSIVRGAAAFPTQPAPGAAASPSQPALKKTARESAGRSPQEGDKAAPTAPATTEAPQPSQTADPAPPPRPEAEANAPKPAPLAAIPAAEQPASPSKPEVVISRSMLGPPDPAAGKLFDALPAAADSSPANELTPQPAARASLVSAPRSLMPPAIVSTTQETEAAPAPPKPPSVPVPRTEFGIDLGGASSFDSLRTIWLRLIKSHKTLSALTPIVTLKERSNGAQLRLIAGPITDAATAAKLCAGLTAADQFCETAMYDGQRLSLKSPKPAAPPAAQATKKRTSARFTPTEPEPAEPAPPPPPAPAQPHHSSLPSFLGIP